MMDRNGFTVLELLVVVAIIGLLVALAIPNLQTWASDQRLRADMVQVEGDLQIARMTAINRNAPIAVRFNTPAANQYIAFIDNGSGGGTARNLIKDGAEAQLFQRALSSDISIAAVDFGGQSAVLFNGKGLRGLPTAGNAFVELRNPRGKTTRISVTLVGDVNVT